MSDNSDLRKVVGEIAGAYFRENRVAPSEIPTIINQIAARLATVSAPKIEPPPEPAMVNLSRAQIRKSIKKDTLISFEDNRPYKTLWRHLAARRMSPEEYRGKWGLPDDYPMAAPSYRQARASLVQARSAALAQELAELTSNSVRPEPASDTGPPATPSNAPLAEAAAAQVLAVPPPKASLRGVELLRAKSSTPTAFRPNVSDPDPETSSRHQRWLAMLSETDWARIRAIARQVNQAHVPAALSDLTAPLRVRACLAGHEARFPGEHVGTLRNGQVAILIADRTDR